jgi:hypothetical protein
MKRPHTLKLASRKTDDDGRSNALIEPQTVGVDTAGACVGDASRCNDARPAVQVTRELVAGHTRVPVRVDCNRATSHGRLVAARIRCLHGNTFARRFSWPRLPEVAMLSNEGRPRELGDPRVSEWW